MGGPIRGLEGLGAHLRKVRVSRKLSLDSVAELTGGFREPVTKSHLSRIENGLAEPSFRRLYALCQVYKVSITSLAEKYELDLRKEASGRQPTNKMSVREMLEEAAELRRSGDYVTALAVYEMLLDQESIELEEMTRQQSHIQLRLYRINCHVRLGYYNVAKDEVEELLDHKEISRLQRCEALNFLGITIWRQGRMEYASVVLAEAINSADGLQEESVIPSIQMTQGNIAFRLGLMDDALDYFQNSSRRYCRLSMHSLSRN